MDSGDHPLVSLMHVDHVQYGLNCVAIFDVNCVHSLMLQGGQVVWSLGIAPGRVLEMLSQSTPARVSLPFLISIISVVRACGKSTSLPIAAGQATIGDSRSAIAIGVEPLCQISRVRLVGLERRGHPDL